MKPTSSRTAPPVPARPAAGSGRPLQGAQAKSLAKKSVGGRPPKYAGPSRPITVTLPESTLKGLEHIHPDRGKAIVKLTEAALRTAPGSQPLVEIVEMAANTGLLIVGPSKTLRRIPFLHLVEVAPGRFLLALDSGNDFKNLEIAIHDVLEDVPESEARERELIRLLLERIRHVRKSERVSMAEILFVKLKEKGGAAMHSVMHTVACLFTVVA